MHVRFLRPVTIGSVEHEQWSRAAPGSTALAGKIDARRGDPKRGEHPDSVVFEVRIIPSDPYDVEVPLTNIAHVIRARQPQQPRKP